MTTDTTPAACPERWSDEVGCDIHESGVHACHKPGKHRTHVCWCDAQVIESGDMVIRVRWLK